MAKDATAALRQRRYRDRQRRCLQVVTAEVSDEFIDRLIDAGLLGEDEAAQPERIGEAIVRISDAVVHRDRT
jgi:hypothetical protein